MTRKAIVKTFIWIFISWVLLASLNPGAQAESKNYYFPEVNIDLRIDKDSSFTVGEYRTYDFQGSFSWATLWIPLRVNRQGYEYNLKIEDFKVLDEQDILLETETSIQEAKFEAKWNYRANDERRTFHIHYRVRGGIISYPEISELYWQIIGSEWDKPTKHVVINVHLPQGIASKSDILVYGHGPLSGRCVIVDEETARFSADNLSSRQFVEIRVAWPAGLVSGIASNRHSRESIRQEEARFVEETIERARRALEREKHNRKIFLRLLSIWGIWLILGPLIWLPFYLRIWKKAGKDYRFEDIPEYFHELPSSLSPALVEVLLREGREITPSSFTATLFDLARRGFIEIQDRIVEKKVIFGRKEEYETTVTLRKDFRRDPKLFPYETEVLDFLFVTVARESGEKGSKFELDALKSYLKKKPQKFQKWYLQWRKQIQTESKKLRFLEPESMKIRNIFYAVTLPLAVITLNPVLLVLGLILVPKIKRREMNWARENELWKAFRHFLDDFSSFKDLPPEAYKLWEHYLVFGILFGIAHKILKMLPIILKDERAVSPIWYYGFSQRAFVSSGRLESMIRSIESMSSSIHQASTSAAHYSSGSGGGFSGGGRGGGGGGGGSAG